MKTVANPAPASKTVKAPSRLNAQGQSKAPTKYPSAFMVFIAPAKV